MLVTEISHFVESMCWKHSFNVVLVKNLDQAEPLKTCGFHTPMTILQEQYSVHFLAGWMISGKEKCFFLLSLNFELMQGKSYYYMKKTEEMCIKV